MTRKPRRPRREFDVLIKPGTHCIRLYGPKSLIMPVVVRAAGHRFGAYPRLTIVPPDLLDDLLAGFEHARVRVHVPVRRPRPVPQATLFEEAA